MDTTLGNLIQSQRRKMGLKVEDLAERTNLSVGTIRAIEQGRRTPSVEAFAKIETILDIEDGQWIESDTWVDPSGNQHVLALMPGGKPRVPKSQDIRLTRFLLIEKIMEADEETVAALDWLLK